MDLVKWLRKNNKKLMAVVVIGLMIAFVGSAFLRQLARPSTSRNETLAYYGDDVKIKSMDLALAHQDLEILKALSADVILKNIGVPPLRVPDLHAFLLGELLFANQTTAPVVLNYTKQLIMENGYWISNRQINEIYAGSMQPHLYWLLLKNEAARMGIKVQNDNVANQLSRIIPSLSPGATYSALIGAIVNRYGVSEERILTTFGHLMAVMESSKNACAGETLTNTQLMYSTVKNYEIINTEYVKLNSAFLIMEIPEPPIEDQKAHFEKYKSNFTGQVSDDNPYGFGYKFDDMVRLEYMALKLDDIEAIVQPPTQEETEEFYQRNRQQFAVPVLSDPNDPNSPQVEKIQSYGEVVNLIKNQLLQGKISAKAAEIFRDARSATEAELEALGSEAAAALTPQQYREKVGDYKTAAEQIGKKYNVTIYTRRTGLLDATDIRRDPIIGMLYLTPTGNTPAVGLGKMVFAVDELAAGELGIFDPPRPRMYENIGPLSDVMARTMAVVRVVQAEKAAEPERLEQTCPKDSIALEKDPKRAESFWVKGQVIEDLQRLSVMDTVKTRAEELVSLVETDGWDEAIKKFNDLYAIEPDPNGFAGVTYTPRTFPNLRVMPRDMFETMVVQTQGNPEARVQRSAEKREKQLVEAFYSLLPEDSNSIADAPAILEFKPDLSYFVINKLSVNRLEEKQYEMIKASQIFRETVKQSQSLAAVFYNPKNILDRNDFKPVVDQNPNAETTPNSPPAETTPPADSKEGV